MQQIWWQTTWAAYARSLAFSNKPILVGPWRSEVGFEVLYWIPFLNRFREQFQIPPDRLIAIGRGGSAQWYGMNGTADLYEHMPVEMARQLNVLASQQTGSIKQHQPEGWESHVCALTAKGLGITKYRVLSPMWMYQLLTPWWQGTATEALLDRYTLQPVKFVAPPLDPEIVLPERFVAMRWYTRATWPYREDLVLWMRALVEKVASQMPVVLIDSFHADDHADIHLGPLPNVIRLSELADMTPLNNLAIQSSVIAKAQAYVGTYGGMSQLALRLGVPTVALYQEFGQTAPAHLTLSQTLAMRTHVPFIACQPKDIDGPLSLVMGKK